MVTESTRPRRSVAVDSVKRASNSLKSGLDQQKLVKQSTPLKKTKSIKSRRKGKAVESENDSSDLSDAEKENNGISDNEKSDEEAEEEDEEMQKASDTDEELMSPSESEKEIDETSDYEEGGKQKRKRALKAQQAKVMPAKKAKKAKTAANKITKKARKQPTKRRASISAAKAKQMNSKEDLPINDDNELFNCLKDVEIDLQSTAEDWLKSYQNNEGTALAQLITSVFRSAGCNATIDEVQVLDHDSIADTLDAIQESLKKEVMPSYPLVSRAATFRKFRRRLSDWIEKLFICIDEADVIYDETLMETILAWISAMSSSAFRSLRHTSTLIALLMIEQVSRMTKDNRAEINAAVKSRESEKIKGAKASKDRVKDLDLKVKEVNQIKKQLEGFQQELIDTVYIHRYRDSDASIRADCIGQLGRWMKNYPEQYLSTSYFRYFGWVLSDQSEIVRLLAVKSLSSLYHKHEYEGAIQQFTQRFLPRMVEMAVGDVDLSVRIATIATLTAIDQSDVLEEEQIESISSHIFDVEPRIRAVVALFIKQRLDTEMDEAEDIEEESEALKLRWKLLAQTLIKLSNRLNQDVQVDKSNIDTVTTFGEGAASRISLAVGAIWDVDEKLQDWTSLIELLLYDHSSLAKETTKTKRRGAASNKEPDSPAKEAYRLEADEETILLESVGVVLDRLQGQSASATKAQEGSKDGEVIKDEYSTMTRHLIPLMSKLFKKYKTEMNRIVEVLGIAKRLKMDSYVEFQQVAAFESLWDDVIDQFVRHVEDGILGTAALVMVAMNGVTALSNINVLKMAHLKETIIQSLQDGMEEVATESSVLEEEQLHRLTSSASRIKHLIRLIDLAPDLDSAADVGADAGSADSTLSCYEILLACAKRGEKGVADEESLVKDSLVILSLYTMWSTRALLGMAADEERDTETSKLIQKRSKLLDVMYNLLDDRNGKTTKTVKAQAFRQVLDLHILFASVQASGAVNVGEDEEGIPSHSKLRLKCDIETQAKLASFVEGQLFTLTREISQIVKSSSQDDDDDDDDDDEATPAAKSHTRESDDTASQSLKSLQRQMDFVSDISHYIGAIRLGIVHIRYSTAVLSMYGRLGPIYDACLRILVETIREEGISESKPERACNVVLDSLLQAHSLYCHDLDNSEETCLINLAKMLSSSLVVRGAQLAIVKKVDGRAVMNMHSRGIKVVFEKLQKDPEADVETQQKALSLFKALSQLLVSIEPREAITIKKDMDRLMEEYNVQVPLTAKTWDALRQYEKRLVTIASKSDSVQKHLQANKAASMIKSRPKPKPLAINQDAKKDQDEDEGSMIMEEEGTEDETREEHQLDITMEDGEDDAEAEE